MLGVISIQGATKNSFNSGLDKIDKTKIASVEKVRIGAKITSKNYSVLNIPKDLESVVDDIVKNGDSGGNVQGSQDWVETILNDKLQSNNPIKKIIEEASNNGKLHIGVSGINKKDKNLIVVPVNVKN